MKEEHRQISFVYFLLFIFPLKLRCRMRHCTSSLCFIKYVTFLNLIDINFVHFQKYVANKTQTIRTSVETSNALKKCFFLLRNTLDRNIMLVFVTLLKVNPWREWNNFCVWRFSKQMLYIYSIVHNLFKIFLFYIFFLYLFYIIKFKWGLLIEWLQKCSSTNNKFIIRGFQFKYQSLKKLVFCGHHKTFFYVNVVH